MAHIVWSDIDTQIGIRFLSFQKLKVQVLYNYGRQAELIYGAIEYPSEKHHGKCIKIKNRVKTKTVPWGKSRRGARRNRNENKRNWNMEIITRNSHGPLRLYGGAYMRLRQDRSGNLDCGHSIVSGFSVILLKPLIGVGKDKESGKEFQGYFRISAGKDRGYFVSAVPNKRRRCIKEIEEKKKSVCCGSQIWQLRRRRELMWLLRFYTRMAVSIPLNDVKLRT